MTVSPPTPCLVVDVDVLDANIAAMADKARSIGAGLRPHAKTHKSPDVARRQLAAGAHGLSVASVAEAESFAAAGFDDLFIAYPLWVDEAKAARLRVLLDNTTLSVGVDSAEAACALAAGLGHGQRSAVHMVIEIDSGHHRTGVAPELAGALAEQVQAVGLAVAGVFTFPGHGYSPGVEIDVAAQEAAALATAAASLRAVGIEPRVVSGGSTPTAGSTTTGAITEMRPGVYVFGDAQQWELGTTPPQSVALTCLATVVSHSNGHVVLDSGSKALGADRPTWATGYGRLLDHPAARIVALSEHHAVVEWPDQPLPRLGSRLRVVPNHVCSAVNLTDELVVVSADTMVDRWPVSARGANT